jgi:hypothetical protein
MRSGDPGRERLQKLIERLRVRVLLAARSAPAATPPLRVMWAGTLVTPASQGEDDELVVAGGLAELRFAAKLTWDQRLTVVRAIRAALASRDDVGATPGTLEVQWLTSENQRLRKEVAALQRAPRPEERT